MSNIAAMLKVSEGHPFRRESRGEGFDFRDSLRANVTDVGRGCFAREDNRKWLIAEVQKDSSNPI
jgi:hypothetical protein